jgi:hypothetical protein
VFTRFSLARGSKVVTRSASPGKLVLAGIAGILVGVLGSFAGGYVWAGRNAEAASSRAAGGREPVRTAQPASIVVERHTSSVDEARLAALEQRLAELAPPAPGASARQALTPLETQQRYEAQLQQHAAEPVDPSWSRPTASLIEADVLKQAGSMSVRLGRVDCRTTSCTAELEWPSLAEADREYLSLVHFPYRANCSRTVLLPPPSKAEGPLRAQMLLDCESWRAEGGEPLEASQGP